MCVTCAEAGLLLGNLWQEGGAPVVAEVRFSFRVIVTVQSCKISVAYVCVLALMLGILGVYYKLLFIYSLMFVILFRLLLLTGLKDVSSWHVNWEFCHT